MLISLHLGGADGHNFVSSECIRAEKNYRFVRNNFFSAEIYFPPLLQIDVHYK